MKELLDFISEFIEITGNGIIDNVLLLLIGTISFYIAFFAVGNLFDIIDCYNSILMSIVHWIIRIFCFFFLSIVCIILFKFINWINSIPLWIKIVSFILITSVIILIIVVNTKNRQKIDISINKNYKKQVSNVVSKEENIKNNNDNKKYICPWCGGRLVKRYGPYGPFYGCENFSKKGCRYTKKVIK